MSLITLYTNYFKKYNCTNLFEITNTYSRPDALMQSGQSKSFLIEFKNRDCVSITQYETSIIEKDKHDALIQASKSIDSNFYFYVVEYQQLFLIFQIDKLKVLEWDSLPCPYENGSEQIKLKEVAYLPYCEAELIISKKDWQRKSIGDLEYYLMMMRKKYYEND